MASADFVDEVLAQMTTLNVSQSALARECGISQPHLSRVLGKQLKPGKKTRLRLEKWMTGSSAGGVLGEMGIPTSADLERLVRRLGSGTPERRMHVMQMLRALEAMVSES